MIIVPPQVQDAALSGESMEWKVRLPINPSSRHLRSILFPSLLLLSLAMTTLPFKASAQTTVHKVADPLVAESWVVSDDSSAGGSVTLVPESPAEIQPVSKQSMLVQADFSGTGFEFYKATPKAPLVIPGVTKSVSLWVRADGQDYGWDLVFKDGWGRTEANGQKFQWEITKGAGPAWKKVTFTVPPDWVQPLTIDSVFVHNWDSKTKKASARVRMDDLEVETDISSVDPDTGLMRNWKPNPDAPKTTTTANAATNKAPLTPLLMVSLSAAQEHNVFSGVKPEFRLQARNWNPGAASGTVEWKLTDYRGNLIKGDTQSIKVADNLSLPLQMVLQKFGLYQLDITVTWEGGKKVQSNQPFAVIPAAHELTEKEKDASPYGLNVLGARQQMVSTFRKAGIIWYRDYGFNYDWMVRAKGADKSYGGWPWYPKMVKQYESNGVRVLANLQTAIKPPSAGAAPGPDLAWTREMVGILTAFPYLNTFELDNEYDLGGEHIKAETPINWQNYRSYHKKFGEIARLLGGGQFTAVENGRAGIWPERVRQEVKSGDFAPIDVVNSHYYTGAEPPEVSVINHNMGQDASEATLILFDQLRAAKRAGASDGKQRQHWLTEFGWDTKAGPVVTPIEQAAYLQRMYMMLAAAGTEKGFWFFDLDGPTANQFFDGCGLFTFDQLPKLSYAAYAGLTQILPRPEYLGMINAGPGTWGYLFRNDGKLIASLWSLTGDKKPAVDFEGAKVYDFLANPLPNGPVPLGIEPVYAVGVPETSRWFRQAAYSLRSPYLVAVTAGDNVTAQLHVINNRKTAMAGKVHLELPFGWTNVRGDATVAVNPSQTADIPLTFRVDSVEPLGEKSVGLVINEGEPLHNIPLRVQIQPPLAMSVRGLQGPPGSSGVVVHLTNRSAQPLNGALHFTLPASWNTPTPNLKVAALKPGEARDITTKVQWNAEWKAGEAASVEFRSEDGRSVQQPLIPGRLAIHHVGPLAIDGRLKGWPAAAQIPSWVLGSTAGASNSAVYLGWSEEGLYVGVQVHDTKAMATDPRSFWIGDVLELFVDTADKKTPRAFGPGDHQFWLIPQVDKNRVYVGQWKRGAEITETKYDLPGIRSAAVRTADGYLMQCLLPASLLHNFKPTPGARLGLNLNLSVKGAKSDREVFWTLPKSEGVTDHPENWGTVMLAP